MNENCSYIIPAILGFLFGVLPLLVFEFHKEHRTRRRIALAINQEIKSLFKVAEEKGWTLFLEGYQTEIGEYLPPTTFDYFKVYDSNLHLITLLESGLSQNMIDFYNKAKALLEDVKIYAENVKEGVDKNELEKRRKRLVEQYSSHKVLRDEIAKGVGLEDKKVFIVSRLRRTIKP